MTRAELLRIALAHALGKLRFKKAPLGISEEFATPTSGAAKEEAAN